MNPSRNPIHLWLGLPADIVQPAAWQLLRLNQDESDASVVEQAAQRARDRLAAVDPGENSAVRDRLYEEIDNAEKLLVAQINEQSQSIASAEIKPLDPMAPFQPSVVSEPTAPATSIAPTDLINHEYGNGHSPTRSQPPELEIQPEASDHPESDLPIAKSERSARKIAMTRRGDSRSANWVIVVFAGLTVACVGGGIILYAIGYFDQIALVGPPKSNGSSKSDSDRKKTKTTAKKEQQEAISKPIGSKKPTKKTPQAEINPMPPVTKQPPIRPSLPETKPKKPETPPPTVFSKEKAKQVVQHLQAARDALKQADFPLAEQQVIAAQKLNPTEKYVGPIERLKLIGAYAKQFQTRFRESVSEFKPGSELRIPTATGEKICAVVEATPQMIILRVNGVNQRHGFNGLNPAIAIAMVHTVVKTDDPITKVIDAAFLATRKNPTSRETMRAQELFKQARSLGADIGMLEMFLQDDYERLINP